MLAPIFKIRFIWLTLVFFLILFLAWQYISPSGSWTCRQSFDSPAALSALNLSGASSCLGQASPAERTARGASGPLLVLGEPVYFSVFSPRPFSNVRVEITYRPHLSSSTPIFEAGFLADKQLWRYRLRPVYNLWLERGLAGWEELDSDSLRLFQREHKFDSVPQFLDAWRNRGLDFCSTPRCLAVYNLSLENMPPALDLQDFIGASSSENFPYQLRGAHQFYIFLPADGLELSGFLTDLNENKEADAAEFSIFSGQKRLDSAIIPDSRPQKEESYEIGSPQAFNIVRTGLPAGLYRLEFRASDDLILSGLKINASYLSVINKIWAVGDGPISLVTDAAYLQAKALSPASLQRLEFGGRGLSLDEIYRQYEIDGKKSGILKIDMPAGGLILANNGMFAASASSLLNPDYPRLDRFAFPDDGFDFVLADYAAALPLEDSWLKSAITMPAADLYREDNRYSLMLSVPGLDAGGGQGGFLEIKDIEIKFSGAGLLDKIKDYLGL